MVEVTRTGVVWHRAVTGVTGGVTLSRGICGAAALRHGPGEPGTRDRGRRVQLSSSMSEQSPPTSTVTASSA